MTNEDQTSPISLFHHNRKLKIEEVNNRFRIILEIDGTYADRLDAEAVLRECWWPALREAQSVVDAHRDSVLASKSEVTRPIVQLEPLAYSINQAVELLPIGRSALYNLMNSGELRTVKLGGRRVIPVAELHKLFDACS
jgi:excisionase family DNA binding protein